MIQEKTTYGLGNQTKEAKVKVWAKRKRNYDETSIPKNRNKSNNNNKKNKSLDTCHFFEKLRHLMWNYRTYLDSLKKVQVKQSESISSALIIEINLVVSDFDSCCLDSAFTSHVCNVLHGYNETRRLNEGEIILRMVTKAIVTAVSIGDHLFEFILEIKPLC